ncbi:PH domain-containing protein [Aureibacillus halotolerans]|uniref:Putative membrane protein n=1 Tax=Aureibacillus halotolerans TaxID=1508390 RepID=A0A4R6TXX4_9BACI|nr:PH domain-containing protein [Aureibacillus halotolerans]TDQ36735.1 putative membrane protein [Aureibacillus halotolerans]
MNDARRVHPLSLLFGLLKSLKDLIIPVIALGFLWRDYFLWTVLGVIVVIILIALSHLLSWWRFTYQIEDQQLHIKQGVFVRKERYISRERIHSTDISETVLHQFFKVVKLKIETAGGKGEPEVALTAISKEEAVRIQTVLDDGVRRSPETDDGQSINQAETTQQTARRWKLPSKHLWMMAATSGGVWLIITGAFGFLSQFDQFFNSNVTQQTLDYVLRLSYLFIGLLAILLFIVLYGAAMIGTFLKYSQFVLEESNGQFKISRGLLNKTSKAIDIDKIQAVRVQQSLIRQLLGFVTVYVESAGGSSKDENVSTILVPFLHENNVQAFLQDWLPSHVVHDETAWERSPKRAVGRYILRTAWLPALGSIAFSIWLYPYGLLALIVFIGAVLYGIRCHSAAAVRIHGDTMQFRYHGISKNYVTVRKRHIQSYTNKGTLFQKRPELTNMSFAIMSNTSGKTFEVKDLEVETGGHAYKWFSRETE